MKITPDIVTISNSLRIKNQIDVIGGDEYLSEIITEPATSRNIENWCKIIKDHHANRVIIETCHNVTGECFNMQNPNDTISMLEKGAATAGEIITNREEVQQVGSILSLALNELETAHIKKTISGVSTGIRTLDEKICGLSNTNLILIAARPGAGKSALMISIARHVAGVLNIPVLIFSLEMSKSQLVQRLLSIESKLDLHKMRGGKLENFEYNKLGIACGPIAGMPLWIDDTPAIKPLQIKAKIRRFKADKKLGLVFIDHIQIAGADGRFSSANERISSISASYKCFAKEYNIPIVALSQLSREIEKRPKKYQKPTLADLRDSGSLEQDADDVIFIHRPGVYDKDFSAEDAELIIGKQRNGPVGNCKVRYIKENTLFEDIADDGWGPEESPKKNKQWQDKI